MASTPPLQGFYSLAGLVPARMSSNLIEFHLWNDAPSRPGSWYMALQEWDWGIPGVTLPTMVASVVTGSHNLFV